MAMKDRDGNHQSGVMIVEIRNQIKKNVQVRNRGNEIFSGDFARTKALPRTSRVERAPMTARHGASTTCPPRANARLNSVESARTRPDGSRHSHLSHAGTTMCGSMYSPPAYAISCLGSHRSGCTAID